MSLRTDASAPRNSSGAIYIGVPAPSAVVVRMVHRELSSRSEVHEDDPPAILAHDVLRLDVAVDQACGVHRRQRPAEIHADDCRFVRSEWSLLTDDLLQRPPLDVVHPETDASVEAIRAEDGHDVRMSHACEETSLVDHQRRDVAALRGSSFSQQLERDLAGELGIPGLIDLAEGASAETRDERQIAPRAERGRRRLRNRIGVARSCGVARARATRRSVVDGWRPGPREFAARG